LQETRGLSVTEIEFRAGALERERRVADSAKFYLLRSPPRTGVDEAAMRLRATVEQSGYPVQYFDQPDELADLVLRDWVAVLERDFPLGVCDPTADADSSDHSAFFRSRARWFSDVLERPKCLAMLTKPSRQRITLISGEAGCGKTAIVANWLLSRAALEQHREPHPVRPRGLRAAMSRLMEPKAYKPEAIFIYSAETSESSAHWTALLYQFVKAARTLAPWLPQPASDPLQLTSQFALALDAIGRTDGLFLVIDAIDTLGQNDIALLPWLPSQLPPHVRLLCTARPGIVADHLMARGASVSVVAPLGEGARRRLMDGYLTELGKNLQPELVGKLVGAPAASALPFTITVLEDLRVFGEHELIADRVATYLSCQSYDDLLVLILERLEGDYAEPTNLVASVLSALALSRSGLTEKELLSSIIPGETVVPYARWAPLRASLAPHVVEVRGRIRLASEQLRSIVLGKYARTSEASRAIHRRLAQSFRQQDNLRGLMETPWHYAFAGDWDAVTSWISTSRYLKVVWDSEAADVSRLWHAVHSEAGITPVDGYASTMQHPEADPDTAIRVAALLRRRGDLGPACSLVQRLVEIGRGWNNDTRLEPLLGDAALAYRQSGMLSAAKALLLEQQQMVILRGDRRSLAACLGNLGVVLRDLGLTEDAIRTHREEEKICDEIKDSVGSAKSRVNQAALSLMDGEVKACETLLNDAEGDLARVGDGLGLQAILEIRGTCLQRRGKRQEALRCFVKQEELNRRLANEPGIQKALMRQASAQQELMNYDAATDAIEKCERLAAQARDELIMAEASALKASIFINAGFPRLALPAIKAAELLIRSPVCVEHVALRDDILRIAKEIRRRLHNHRIAGQG